MRVSAWLYLLQQLLTSACFLWAAGLCAGMNRPRPWRTLPLSALMALLAMAAPALPTLLRLLLVPLAGCAPLAVFPDAPLRLKPRIALMGLLLPVGFTGLMRLFAPLGLPGTLLLSAACAMTLLACRACARAAPVPRISGVEIRMGLRSAAFTALVDTGNLLRDSVTGLPVIVISRKAAAKLMTLPREGALLPGMRLMRVRTVSGTALMTILRADSIRIRQEGAWRSVSAVIGLSPCGYEGFQALLPAALISAPDDLPRQALSQQTGG